MGIDVLSDVLSTIRLTGAVFFDVRCVEPWVQEAPRGSLIVDRVLPGVEHLIPYHVVSEGSCWAGAVGDELNQLEAGSIIVFPHGDAHVLSSAPGMRQPPVMEVYALPSDGQLPIKVEVGEGASVTRLVCGYLGCDARPFNPLLAALPRVLVIKNRRGEPGSWLSGFVDIAVAESRDKRAGGQSVLGRLSELMFVEVLRRYLDGLESEETGWLAGLRDPYAGRALSLLHEKPAHPWTLEDLAREVGLSRSAFAERFTHYVGQPPMQYLSRWRMQVAAGMLAKGSKVVQVAFEVGYDSEAAFSRAFKRMVGASPATWRERRPPVAASPVS